MPESIVFASMNVQGLGDKIKRKDVLNYLKEKNTVYTVYKIHTSQMMKLSLLEASGVMNAILVTSIVSREVLQFLLITISNLNLKVVKQIKMEI